VVIILLINIFAERVMQDVRRRVTACYVALESETDCVVGYYTLSAADIPLTDIPEDMIKHLPRYHQFLLPD